MDGELKPNDTPRDTFKTVEQTIDLPDAGFVVGIPTLNRFDLLPRSIDAILAGSVVPAARIAARLRVVHDVTGAGDNFLAVLGCARGLGVSWPVAAELANVAAGLQVERHGCVPVTLAELQTEVEYERATIAGPGCNPVVRDRGWLAEAG